MSKYLSPYREFKHTGKVPLLSTSMVLEVFGYGVVKLGNLSKSKLMYIKNLLKGNE